MEPQQLTKLSNAEIFAEANHRQADESENAIRNNPWRPNLVLVACPRQPHHDEAGENVGWGNQTIASRNAEAHSIFEDDWKKVRNGICDGRCEHVDQGKAPDLEIQAASKVLSEVELLCHYIMPVLLDSRHDKVHLVLLEELFLYLAGLSS